MWSGSNMQEKQKGTKQAQIHPHSSIRGWQDLNSLMLSTSDSGGWRENSSKAHPITLQSFLKIEPSQSPLSYLFCNSNVSIQLTKLLRTFGFQSLWNNLILIWKLNCIDKLNNTPSFRTRANESSSLRKCTRVQKLCFYPFLKPVSRKCLHMDHDLPGALLCSRTAVILYVWASGLTSLTTAWISFIWERTKSTL